MIDDAINFKVKSKDRIDGKTGIVQFDTNGYRTNISLYAHGLTPNRTKASVKIGVWENQSPMFVQRFKFFNKDKAIVNPSGVLKSKMARVVTILVNMM